ncbi:TPA: glycosyltransferase [Photobacterium damselae]
MSDEIFISVIIKTYNEQEGIEKTICSIRKHMSNYPHKIIVADSLSTDDTQKIAQSNNVEVISLVDPSDRCCGVGHQLGYLLSEGDYLLLLDGDMELEDGFIHEAVQFLQNNQDYAGVAGMVEMDDVESYEFRARKQRIHQIYPLGDCDHLGGGGLYRKSAIDQLGYLTNRNLHAYEESELGMRLIDAGYKLHRLSIPYFKHTSYDMPSLEMLKYRWKNGYLFSSGELVRSAWGKPYFKQALKTIKNEAIFAAYLILVALSIMSLDIKLFIFSLIPILSFWGIKVVKNKSIKDATQSVINMMFFSAGLLRGLFNKPKDPYQAPNYKIIK